MSPKSYMARLIDEGNTQEYERIKAEYVATPPEKLQEFYDKYNTASSTCRLHFPNARKIWSEIRFKEGAKKGREISRQRYALKRKSKDTFFGESKVVQKYGPDGMIKASKPQPKPYYLELYS